ncbi:hypothetical protein L830_1818 [Mycobacteroides abscessus MAB_082312_2258]|nr:hypothetical protein L830_1818 [Mycobacteroides abscessus MAB_082312_2258]
MTWASWCGPRALEMRFGTAHPNDAVCDLNLGSLRIHLVTSRTPRRGYASCPR